MSLRRKPHTVSVALSEEVIQDNLLEAYVPDAQGSVGGQLEPTTSEVMYAKFAVETARGYIFRCDPGDASKFVEGGEVTYNGRTFVIKGAPKVLEGFGNADNAEIPMEERI